MNSIHYVHVGFSLCLILFFKVNYVQFLYNRICLLSKHKLSQVQLTWLPQVWKKMLLFPNKHPVVLVFVCLIKCLDTTNCKLVITEDVAAIIVLADVMPKVCGRCYCNWRILICGRWKATVVDVVTSLLGVWQMLLP